MSFIFGDTGGTTPAPDFTWANSQWGEQLNTAKKNMADALKWAQDHGTTLDEALKRIQGSTLDTSKDMMGMGTDMLKEYMGPYAAMREAQRNYAMGYASPERIKQAQAEAGAGVSNAFKAAGDAANRNLERSGVDPAVGRGGALDLGVKLAEATGKAGAMDTARRTTETMGQNLINQAIGTGNTEGQMGTSTAQAGAAVGGTGIGEGVNTYAAQSPTLGNSLGWFGGGNQALGGFVNTTQLGFQDNKANMDTMNAAHAADAAGFGKLLGTGMSMLMAAKGGPIPSGATGGPPQAVPLPPGMTPGSPTPGSMVPTSASPSGGAETDDVPARVQPGEFIFPREVMAWRGEQWAQKEIAKAYKEMGQPQSKPAEPEAKPAIDLPPTYMSPGALHGQAVPLGPQGSA